jgi:hypothetical protein
VDHHRNRLNSFPTAITLLRPITRASDIASDIAISYTLRRDRPGLIAGAKLFVP